MRLRKTDIRLVPLGMPLPRDYYAVDGRILFARDVVLSEYEIVKARVDGHDFVYLPEETAKSSHGSQSQMTAVVLDKPKSAGPDLDVVFEPDWTIISFEEAYTEFIVRMKDFFEKTKGGRPLERAQIERTVEAILVVLLRGNVSPLQRIRKMKDHVDYFNAHPINVAFVSGVIGRWMKLPVWVNKDLVTAALLHDIGKATLDQTIFTKPDRLTDEEFETMKKHPRAGANIVGMLYPEKPELMDAVLQHHERMDGSGYPGRLIGEATSQLARVIAVADVYDAITSKRAYAAKESPFMAAETLRSEGFGKLDPKVIQILYNHMTKFSIGSTIQLSDGRTGSVVYINPSLPTRPVVDVEGQLYDLSRQSHIHVAEVLE
ncbi:MAG: HD-GYP domain-containing protein [Solirubrobacterales bacterium]